MMGRLGSVMAGDSPPKTPPPDGFTPADFDRRWNPAGYFGDVHLLNRRTLPSGSGTQDAVDQDVG